MENTLVLLNTIKDKSITEITTSGKIKEFQRVQQKIIDILFHLSKKLNVWFARGEKNGKKVKYVIFLDNVKVVKIKEKVVSFLSKEYDFQIAMSEENIKRLKTFF